VSPIAAREPRVRRSQRTPPVAPRGRARRLLGREAVGVFATAYAFYAAVGLYTTLVLHVVVGDAESRLAHAFFVWWNEPAKLSAIGFVWPPVQTLVLLPLALVRPFATSLAALPLTSAVFGAGLLVLVDKALAHGGVERRLRWAIVAAFGLNPLIVFYAGNGMAEIVFLYFLTAAFALLVRWTRDQRWQDPILIGFAFGVGILARYEVAAWLPLAVAGIATVLARRRASAARIEATLIATLTPVVYAVLLWVYLNWSLTGKPIAFFTEQVPGAAPLLSHGASLVLDALVLQLKIFPLTLAVAFVALWIGARRRAPLGLVLGLALCVNPLTTAVLVLRARDPILLQVRYNLRAVPLVLVAAAWLLGLVAPARRRLAALALLALLAASIPVTAATMLRSEHVLSEGFFLDGLIHGRDQDGRVSPLGTRLSIRDEREMAAFVKRHVRGGDTVLTDDAATFGVMLADGHPARYFDRIDRGDRVWSEALRNPVGRAQYILVKRGAVRANAANAFDRIVERYPQLGRPNGPKFARLAHANRTFALYAIEGLR
jgi:hypothetical protein